MISTQYARLNLQGHFRVQKLTSNIVMYSGAQPQLNLVFDTYWSPSLENVYRHLHCTGRFKDFYAIHQLRIRHYIEQCAKLSFRNPAYSHNITALTQEYR